MSDKREEIEKLIKASIKLIKQAQTLATKHRELVDELKKNIAKYERIIEKRKSD